MDVRPTRLPEVLLIELEAHPDARGQFVERFHAPSFAESGLPTHFPQHNHSRSRCNVLRGLHYQLRRPQGKLVMCTRGRVWDVAVDIRVGSPTFGKWAGMELSEEKPQLLWIPVGFAHGFCALAEPSDIEYKTTDVYVASDQHGILWNDPELRIEWPISAPILSERDGALPTLAAAAAKLPAYQAVLQGGASK